MDVNNIEKKVWAYIKANNMLEDCSNAVCQAEHILSVL